MSFKKILTPKVIFVVDQCPENKVYSAGHGGVIKLKGKTTFGDHFIS